MTVSPDRRTRVHTSSALRRRGVLSLALMQAIATMAMASPASAATPTPNTAPISQTSVGSTAPDQTSTTGGTADDLTQTVTGGQIVGSTDGTPAVALSSTGGTGSTGLNGDASYGGAGGLAGQVWLEMDQGSAVVSTGTGNAVWLNSQGGLGGTAGDQQTDSGTGGAAGQPGHGGDSAGILFGQAGSIVSTKGWNGSTPGTTAVLMTANGGDSAEPLDDALNTDGSDGPTGGIGGNGGSIDYKLYEGDVTSAGSAIVALSQGGQGGDGTQAARDLGKGTGGAGGAGGDGGQIQLFIGQPGVASPNITAVGASTAATGATIPVDTNGNVAQASMMAAGIQAQSIGGVGGYGGGAQGLASNAGAGGNAGNGGLVQASVQSTNITTSGFAAAGILAQSIGGAGGNGSTATDLFYGTGGKGGMGGDGGEVDVGLWEPTATLPTGLIATSGDDSVGVAAQSIGGGGGAGGSLQATSLLAGIAIGGSGESGGSAGAVTLYNGYPIRVDGAPAEPGEVIYTTGEHSSALIAQSIGGGGGLGGSAQNTVIGPFNYTVGGNGGSGGSAGTPGTVQVIGYNSGIVATEGNHAKGLVAQAVSGGGGDGGSATALTVNSEGATSVTASVAVGGDGGTASTSGDVQADNVGQIMTSGSDAWGMLAQSISGGGGNGGMSKSDAYAMSASSEVPSVTVNVSLGGNGADGADAGNVTASNSGAILTAGNAAHGILAQSVSGGGGNAGDSSDSTYAAGAGKSIDVTVSMGGNGGNGGTGGAINVDNAASGFIFTAGDSARGILAQSIGGSGGTASAGGADSQYAQAGGSSAMTLTIGGGGGAGSSGGAVTVGNEGSILTMGDSGNGIFAQSIGGGGGLASAAAATGSSGVKSNTALTVTGTGGGDANGGAVQVTNNGNIMTFGGDAAAIYAQSVGGGGGVAGSGSTAGGTSTNADMAKFLLGQSVLATQGYGWSGVTGLQQGAGSSMAMGNLNSLAGAWLSYAAANAIDGPGGGQANDTNVTMLLGGGSNDKSSDGTPTPGDGGNVTVTNNANLQTHGPLSAGIWAQSVGGGGGHTGSTATENYQVTRGDTYKTNITVGGKNLSLGTGGTVTVNNIDGQIVTDSDASFGIFAQSIGAGGGDVSTTSNSYTSSDGTPSTLVVGATGGAGNTQGNGGAVNVTMNPSGNDGSRTTSITTSGNDAVGIVAQSIGGGGGTMTLMQADSTGKGVTDPSADPTGQLVSFQMGGGDADTPSPHLGCPGSSQGYFYYQCGDGGAVDVSVSEAAITTSGRNAHGILAQSFGGGGAWVIGLTLNGNNPYSKDAIMGGNGSNVTVDFDGTLSTTGAGAYGILAQSIGGGGMLGGDLAAASSDIAFPELTGGVNNVLWGNAGDVAINVGADASITTTGANAHGIFAQSVAGGGGLYATTGGQMIGHVSGTTGDVGSISVDNKGLVQVWGNGSSAVVTNTEGNKTPNVTVTNEAGAQLIGTPTAPVVLLTGTSSDSIGTVNNSGSIWARNPDNSVAGSTAISSPTSNANVDNLSGGQILGDVQIKSGALMNAAGGNWGTASSSSANVFNFGTIDVDAAVGWEPTPSVITGSLESTGTIKQSVDFYNDLATNLVVNGDVTLGGTLLIKPDTLAPYGVVTINSTGSSKLGIASDLAIQDASNYLFSYSSQIDSTGQYLTITPASKMVAQASSLSYNEQQVASNLENSFNGGDLQAGLSSTLAQMNAAVTSAAQYGPALDNLSSEGAQAATADRVGASQAFVERMNSCPQFEQTGTLTQEHDCGWVRYINADADHDATSNSVGYRNNGQSVQLGGQREIAPDWFLGGSLAYDTTDMNTRNVQGNIDGNGWAGGVVVKHQFGDWLVSGAINGGRMSYDGSRHLQVGDVDRLATSQFDVTHYGLHSRISKQIPFDSWYLRPYVDLHATHIESGAYTEQGADDLSLKVSASSQNVLSIAPMLEAGGRFDLGTDKTLRLYGGVGGAFYSENAVGADMAFVGGDPAQGTFHVESDLPSERAKVSAGADLKINDRLNVRFEYGGEFASHYEDNAESLKVSYQF